MTTDLEQTKALEQEAEKLLDDLSIPKSDEKSETESKSDKSKSVEAKPLESKGDVSKKKTETEGEKQPFITFTTEAEYTAEVEKAAKRRVQANSDKLTQPLHEELGKLRKQNAEITRKLNEREDEKDILSMVNAKADELGEDKTVTLESSLRKFYKNYRDNQAKLATIEEKDAEVKRHHELLNVAEKRQKARDLFWKHFFSGGEHLISQENDFISEMLSENYSLREMELLAEKRGTEYRTKEAKKPSAKPDSGKAGSGGPGGKFTRENLADYSPKGKTMNQMQKDANALLEQLTG